MADVVELFVPLDALDEPLPALAARALGRAVSQLGEIRLLRRSLDARKERPLGYRLRLEVRRPGDPLPPPRARRERPRWPVGVPAPRVVIVGSGPAGAWAALRLAESGVAATV